LKYFDFVVQEMSDGKGYLIIQSILYAIKIEHSETNDSKVIEIEPNWCHKSQKLYLDFG